ncbi:MAG: hypothetical protein KDJ75_06620 [Alphaproteobacteria bacterium]|nr:hypothetical protein [Alphaproteobacteria bacterium]
MADLLSEHPNFSWAQRLSALEAVFLDVSDLQQGWSSRAALRVALEKVSASLARDLKTLQEEGDFLFPARRQENFQLLTVENVDTLRRWGASGVCPSLVALCAYACDNFEITRPDLVYPLLTAAVLGEVENNQTYHSNMHYRKVLMQIMRLCSVHNDIYEGTIRAFDEGQRALLLIAACVHDLGHDGNGNMIKGVFFKSRMERLSFEFSRPFLERAGLADAGELEKLAVMLLCTDVTPLNSPMNPVNQMKSAYRFHFLGDDRKVDSLNLEKDLRVLQKDKKLTMMSLILHEADVATSAGLGYEMTQYETALYRKEVCDDEARPHHIVDFLNNICQRSMLSEAAQKLYAANLARTLILAEEAVKNGDEPFPAPEHSDFILGITKKNPGQSKAIN